MRKLRTCIYFFAKIAKNLKDKIDNDNFFSDYEKRFYVLVLLERIDVLVIII